MTQEDKELLLKDLCARLPYGVKIKYLPDDRLDGIVLPYLHNGLTVLQKGAISYRAHIKMIKPYLRPMSSMTEEEAFEMFRTVFHQVGLIGVDIESDRFIFKMVDGDGQFAGHTVLFFDKIYSLEQSDWLLSHHFDFRGLIEKGIALEAPEGMYE